MSGKERAFHFGRNRGPRLTACMSSSSSSPAASVDVVVRQCTSRQKKKKGSPSFLGDRTRVKKSLTFAILSICIKIFTVGSIFTRPLAPKRAKTLTRKPVPRHEPPPRQTAGPSPSPVPNRRRGRNTRNDRDRAKKVMFDRRRRNVRMYPLAGMAGMHFCPGWKEGVICGWIGDLNW